MNAEQEIRAKLGDFAADQDLMRDVYMTDSQRAAYQRILARALEQHTVLADFESLARWVANCAGHGINARQREQGERLLELITKESK